MGRGRGWRKSRFRKPVTLDLPILFFKVFMVFIIVNKVKSIYKRTLLGPTDWSILHGLDGQG